MLVLKELSTLKRIIPNRVSGSLTLKNVTLKSCKTSYNNFKGIKFSNIDIHKFHPYNTYLFIKKINKWMARWKTISCQLELTTWLSRNFSSYWSREAKHLRISYNHYTAFVEETAKIGFSMTSLVLNIKLAHRIFHTLLKG